MGGLPDDLPKRRLWRGRHKELVERTGKAEQTNVPGQDAFVNAVVPDAFKLMAYKDEYEVARLYTEPSFVNKLNAQFEGDYKLQFKFTPPLIARRNPSTGHPLKTEFGTWLLPMLHGLTKLKFLRGTEFDLFGFSDKRRAERQIIENFQSTVTALCTGLNPDYHRTAVEIANLPDRISGFG